ncbi:MAG: OmpA family protein [Pseudomonadota bacterium]
MITRQLLALSALTILLGACASDQYVKRDEFDSTVSDLRATDAELARDIDGFRNQFTEMTQDLNRKFSGYDATIANLQGRLRVEMSAHFGFDDDSLRDEDKPALDEFSRVVSDYEPHVVVTVEGFTDPSGDPAYNKDLGLRRAKSVAEYLVLVGGLNKARVRAVSYGGDPERMLIPGASGERGAANRRVSLVVDYVGPTPQVN